MGSDRLPSLEGLRGFRASLAALSKSHGRLTVDLRGLRGEKGTLEFIFTERVCAPATWVIEVPSLTLLGDKHVAFRDGDAVEIACQEFQWRNAELELLAHAARGLRRP